LTPLQRFGEGKRPAPGLPHPAVLRSQVFSTSQRLLPPLTFPALFRAGCTPGVFPSRGFPSLEFVAPLDARSPPDVTSEFRPGRLRRIASNQAFALRPPPGVCPSSESVLRCQVLPCITAADPLLGFLPSKGLPGPAMARPSPVLLSRTSYCILLRPKDEGFRNPVPQSFVPHALWLVSLETAVLPGVYSLFTLHIF
jgi:hypothetical protein